MSRAASRRPAQSDLQLDNDGEVVDVDAIWNAIQDKTLSKLKGIMWNLPVECRRRLCLGNDQSDTPLGLAATCNHLYIVSWLLSEDGGADVNAQNSKGSTPLMSACQENNTKVVKELLGSRPDLNLTNQQGYTALHIACKEGHTGLVKTLLSHNADPETSNKQSETPLMAAAVAGHKACIKALLSSPLLGSQRASMTQDSLGRTALMLAVLEGHAEVAKLMLEAGLSPDVKSKNRMTPLMVAAGRGDAKIARLLVKHNADFEPRGPKGLAIDIALEGGHRTVATAIRQGVSRVFPLTGINMNSKITQIGRGVSKPTKGRGKTGIMMPNGDFYEDIPYFD